MAQLAADLPLWRALFRPVSALALFLVPVRVEGLAHLPREGGYLLVSNHISWIDPPWIEFVLRRPIRYLGKSELLAVPVFGGLLRQVGVFAIERNSPDRRALSLALAFLAHGEVVGIFPEGTRSRTGRVRRALPGVGFLARRSGATVVPLAIEGSDRARLGRFWRRDVTIRFGEPFRAADIGAADEQGLADAIMRRVAALLPPERRGEYGEEVS